MTEPRADHAELDLLSAYIDGELEPAEHALLDAHVPGCTECGEVLAALRATLADLAALSQPVLDAASIAALDARLAAERAAAHRRIGRGWAWASGAAAASFIALIATLAIVRAPSDGPRQSGTAAGTQALRALTVASGTDYSPDTARRALARFLDRSREEPAAAGATPESYTAYDASPTIGAFLRSANAGASESDAATLERIARCDRAVRTGTELQPLQYEIARYKGQDAYLLFYERENPSRIELYVVRPSDCATLYFTQEAK